MREYNDSHADVTTHLDSSTANIYFSVRGQQFCESVDVITCVTVTTTYINIDIIQVYTGEPIKILLYYLVGNGVPGQ